MGSETSMMSVPLITIRILKYYTTRSLVETWESEFSMGSLHHSITVPVK